MDPLQVDRCGGKKINSGGLIFIQRLFIILLDFLCSVSLGSQNFVGYNSFVIKVILFIYLPLRLRHFLVQ